MKSKFVFKKIIGVLVVSSLIGVAAGETYVNNVAAAEVSEETVSDDSTPISEFIPDANTAGGEDINISQDQTPVALQEEIPENSQNQLSSDESNESSESNDSNGSVESIDDYQEIEVDLTNQAFSGGGLTCVYPELPESLAELSDEPGMGDNPGDISDAPLLGATNQQIYSSIYNQLKNRASFIDLNSLNVQLNSGSTTVAGTNTPATDYYMAVLNEYADLYYVRTIVSMRSSGTKLLGFTPVYYSDMDDNAFKAETKRALAEIKPGMTDVQKAIALHDYLVTNTIYGGSTMVRYTAYGALVDGFAVCQGYAYAYKYLLNQAGIPAFIVTSDYMNHAWNLIKLGGQYYQIDVTWDDPMNDNLGYVKHNNMLLSDRQFEAKTDHYAWEVSPGTTGLSAASLVSTSTKYDNAYWSAINSPMLYHVDGNTAYYYYAQYDSSARCNRIFRRSADFAAASATNPVCIIDDIPKWNYNTFPFSGVYEVKGRLFYNTPTTINSADFNGSNIRIEYRPSIPSGYLLYGSAIVRGRVVYVLEKSRGATYPQNYLSTNITVDLNALGRANVESVALGDMGYSYASFLVSVSEEVTAIGITDSLGQNIRHKLSEFSQDGNGNYYVVARVYARQMSNPIVLTAYDYQGRLAPFTNTEFVNSNGSYQITFRELLEMMYTYGYMYGNVGLMNVTRSMGIYGDYAAKYFDDKVINSSKPVLNQSDLRTIEANTVTVSGSMPAGLKYAGTSLVLRDGIDNRVYFSLDRSHSLSEFDITYNGKSCALDSEHMQDGLYYLCENLIPVRGLDVKNTITIKKKGASSGCTITFCPTGYIDKALKKSEDENLKDLLRALYLYDSAVKAFGAQ